MSKSDKRMMWVRPADGLRVKHSTKKVRHPNGLVDFKVLSGPEEVEINGYWLRLLADGDVVKIDPPQAPKKAQAKKEGE